MKIWTFSDLHADVHPEVAPFRLPKEHPEHDVVVIAGDLGEDTVKSIRWIADNGFGKPVIYVPGNHDFYGKTIDGNLEDALEEAAKHPSIHLLQNSHVDIDGVRFIGATLWTDYALDGEAFRWAAYTAAQSGMNDHKRIRVRASGYSKFRTKEAYMDHVRSREYITAMLREPFNGPRVVVTHHAPSARSIDHGRFRHSLLNPAYASNLDHLVEWSDLWVHGHIHKTSDYNIGDARVICNPRGYAAYGETTGFDPSLVVDVEPVSHRVCEQYSE